MNKQKWSIQHSQIQRRCLTSSEVGYIVQLWDGWVEGCLCWSHTIACVHQIISLTFSFLAFGEQCHQRNVKLVNFIRIYLVAHIMGGDATWESLLYLDPPGNSCFCVMLSMFWIPVLRGSWDCLLPFLYSDKYEEKDEYIIEKIMNIVIILKGILMYLWH